MSRDEPASEESTDGREPYRIGVVFEAGLSSDDRKQGAHYTPIDVAKRLAQRAWDAWIPSARSVRSPRVFDPSCGGGVFLVAMADVLVAAGIPPETVATDLIFGADLDSGAVDASRCALRAWAAEHGLSSEAEAAIHRHVVVADGLERDSWREAFADQSNGVLQFDIVIGNPPFQSQLGSSTARNSDGRAELKARFGELARRYVDTAALFAVAALEVLAEGGVHLLIQPKSILASADARGVRDRLLEECALTCIWIPQQRIFRASVDVCAPLLIKGATSHETVVVGGTRLEVDKGSIQPDHIVGRPTWSELWANAHDVPQLGPVSTDGTIASLARATAGFRDEYYAVAAHLSEGPAPLGGLAGSALNGSSRRAPVMTTAMVDPAELLWGTHEVRIGGAKFLHPYVDLEAVKSSEDPKILRWINGRRIPKVVIATQTKVIEAVADHSGEFVPLTPLISLEPHQPSDVGRLLTALSAPPATVWALRAFGGAALSSGALKLSAKNSLEIPLPGVVDVWESATEQFAGAGPISPEVTKMLTASWGIEGDKADELIEWMTLRCAGGRSKR